MVVRRSLCAPNLQVGVGTQNFHVTALLHKCEPVLHCTLWLNFGSVLFDNLRNAVFERVGQDATRRLAATVFRHLHRLSLRFHLERRTGAVTKVVERGTKSIDVMLYFLLFNIAPTVLELIAVLVIFWINFGFGLVLATVAKVAI